VQSGAVLAAQIFDKVQRHIAESATPGKHSYLITPRRELEMTRQYVAQVDILQNLPEHARTKLASSMTTMYHVQPGKVIIEKGAVGREMYFIINGTAEVLIGSLEDPPVAQIKKGSFFGEIALLREEVRTAYVRAVTEMDLFVLAKPDLWAVIEEQPELEAILIEAMEARNRK
jgi:CRP-like cAMP-binding protein